MRKTPDTALKLRHLGIRLPIMLSMAVDLLGYALERIQHYLSAPEQRKRDFEYKRKQFIDFCEDANARASHDAADKGSRLHELRFLHGGAGWLDQLRALGVSRESFLNLRALAFLRKSKRALFDVLAPLGPAKLYRLARLHPAFLAKLTLDTPIPTADERRPIRAASLKEIAAWIRTVCPPRKRNPASLLHAHARAARKLLERWPKSAKAESGDLQQTRDLFNDAARGVDRLMRGRPARARTAM